jgi:hypothetical protein
VTVNELPSEANISLSEDPGAYCIDFGFHS